ncbi:unnamed protein product [Ectocarpus sp. 4 AP-2014]
MASTDRDVLVALYNSTGGAGWSQNTNWNTDAPLSQWHGVVVNDQGRVVTLKLYSNKLKVMSKFIEEKAENASMRQSSRCISAAGTTATDTDHPRDAGSLVQPLGSREISATPLVLHSHVFKVSLARTSVTELRQWIVKAASAQECPPGSNFPAVDQAVPKAWIEAYNAMDLLTGTTPCVLWSEAVREFIERMGGSLPDGGEVLLRAMQHREAEGGVLLSLANPSDPVGTDMLHLDPAWLIELRIPKVWLPEPTIPSLPLDSSQDPGYPKFSSGPL